jgi:hypothetical protein
MTILLVHWLCWSWFPLSGYNFIDLLYGGMRHSLFTPFRGVSWMLEDCVSWRCFLVQTRHKFNLELIKNVTKVLFGLIDLLQNWPRLGFLKTNNTNISGLSLRPVWRKGCGQTALSRKYIDWGTTVPLEFISHSIIYSYGYIVFILRSPLETPTQHCTMGSMLF